MINPAQLQNNKEKWNAHLMKFDAPLVGEEVTIRSPNRFRPHQFERRKALLVNYNNWTGAYTAFIKGVRVPYLAKPRTIYLNELRKIVSTNLEDYA